VNSKKSLVILSRGGLDVNDLDPMVPVAREIGHLTKQLLN
jgi:hypothetical protein